MRAIAAELRESPTLPELVRDLEALLEDERARREHFYAEMSEEQKAEFINGEVIVHSPATNRHLIVRDNLQRLLRLHVEARQLGEVRGEKALCVFPRNDYEPDVCFFGPAKSAGLRPDTRKFPIPDFIAEVLSESTEARDRGQKFRDYEAHGVAEYWLVDPGNELVEQYILRAGRYTLAIKAATGEVRSAAVPGFVVPVRALFDSVLNLRALQELLPAAGSAPSS
jgi:Uma2 family endonuclease